MICMAGGVKHEHDTVKETKAHWEWANSPQGAALTAYRNSQDDLEHPGSESRGADRHEEQWEQMEKAAGAAPPKTQATPKQEPLEVGVYKKGEYWYLVVLGQSGYPYAKVLEEADTKSGFRWGYQRGAIREIQAHHKVTAEQAGQFGLIHHVCVNCFRDLSRGESMRRGYGPDCAKNHGWPYDNSSSD